MPYGGPVSITGEVGRAEGIRVPGRGGRNPDTASENRIHADDVAQRYGFQGGLVPGVTVYGYACHALVQALGPAWVEHGTAHVRFVAPCYDGDELVVEVHPPPLAFEVSSRGKGRAWWARPPSPAAGRAAWTSPRSPPPRPRHRMPGPPPDAGFFVAGRVLGSVPLATDQASRRRLPDRDRRAVVGLRRGRDRSSRASCCGGANRVLTANVVLPAWLHVESEVRHLRAVSVGEEVEVRARIAGGVRTQGSRLRATGRALAGRRPSGGRRPSHRHLAAGGIMRLGLPDGVGPACSISTAC